MWGLNQHLYIQSTGEPNRKPDYPSVIKYGFHLANVCFMLVLLGGQICFLAHLLRFNGLI